MQSTICLRWLTPELRKAGTLVWKPRRPVTITVVGADAPFFGNKLLSVRTPRFRAHAPCVLDRCFLSGLYHAHLYAREALSIEITGHQDLPPSACIKFLSLGFQLQVKGPPIGVWTSALVACDA